MQTEIKQISADEIREVFTSKDFVKRLKKAADITFDIDHESGFEIVKDLTADEVCYGIVQGFDSTDDIMSRNLTENHTFQGVVVP